MKVCLYCGKTFELDDTKGPGEHLPLHYDQMDPAAAGRLRELDAARKAMFARYMEAAMEEAE